MLVIPSKRVDKDKLLFETVSKSKRWLVCLKCQVMDEVFDADRYTPEGLDMTVADTKNKHKVDDGCDGVMVEVDDLQ